MDNETTPTQAPKTVPQPIIQAVSDGDAFLEEIGPENEVVVHKAEFNTPGKIHEFFVKEFDQDDSLEVALGPLTFLDNQYVKKPRVEAKLSVATKVHRGIVKNIGTDEQPNWVPVFSLKQIEKMYKGQERGKFLDWALAQVHRINPQTNPVKKKAEAPKTESESAE